MRATLVAIVGAVLVGVTLQQTDSPTESNTDEPTESPPTPAPPTPAPPTPAPPTPAPPTPAPPTPAPPTAAPPTASTDSPTDAPTETSTDSSTDEDNAGAGVVEISITITGMTMAELNSNDAFKTSYIGAIRDLVASTASVDSNAISVTLEEGSVVAIVVFQSPAAAQTGAMLDANTAALQTGVAQSLNALDNKPAGVTFAVSAVGTRLETRTPTAAPGPPTASPTAAPPTAPSPTASPTASPGPPAEESCAAALQWASMFASILAVHGVALLAAKP